MHHHKQQSNMALMSLNDFFNCNDFSLISIAIMSTQQIADKKDKLGQQKEFHLYLRYLAENITGLLGWCCTQVMKVDGIGIKIALLFMQYV